MHVKIAVLLAVAGAVAGTAGIGRHARVARAAGNSPGVVFQSPDQQEGNIYFYLFYLLHGTQDTQPSQTDGHQEVSCIVAGIHRRRRLTTVR